MARKASKTHTRPRERTLKERRRLDGKKRRSTTRYGLWTSLSGVSWSFDDPLDLIIYLDTGSGAEGGQNPDVFWFRSDEGSDQSRVIFEVGISQSLPDLRRRAYALCAASDTWGDLKYVVLIKRYSVIRLYVEIWRRIIASGAGAAAPAFHNDQRAPEALGMAETMEFVANAHASDPGAGRNDALAWQFDLLSSCDIPAGDELVVGGQAVTFDAQTLLNKCRYRDQQ